MPQGGRVGKGLGSLGIITRGSVAGESKMCILVILKMMEFAVVKFLEKNEVAVVPISWLYEDKCYWPPEDKASTILPFIDKGVSPAEYWDLHSIHTLGLFGTYNAARRKLLTAEKRSDLESTDPEDLGRGKRLKQSNYRVSTEPVSDSDASSEEGGNSFPMPPTPQMNLALQKKMQIKNNKRKNPLIEKVSLNDNPGGTTQDDSSALNCLELTSVIRQYDLHETSSPSNTGRNKTSSKARDSLQDDSLTFTSCPELPNGVRQYDLLEILSSSNTARNKSSNKARDSLQDDSLTFTSCPELPNGVRQYDLHNILGPSNTARNKSSNKARDSLQNDSLTFTSCPELPNGVRQYDLHEIPSSSNTPRNKTSSKARASFLNTSRSPFLLPTSVLLSMTPENKTEGFLFTKCWRRQLQTSCDSDVQKNTE